MIFFRKIKSAKPHFVHAVFSQKLVFEIVQKVRVNIPEIPSNILSKICLQNFQKPVFVESAKNINFCYAKSLFLAQQICPFWLVIFYDNKSQILPVKQILKNAIFLNKTLTSKQSKEILYSLNINSPMQKSVHLPQNKVVFAGKTFCPQQTTLSAQVFVHENATLWQTFFAGNFYFFEIKKLKNNKNNIILIKKILFFNNFNYFLIKKQKEYILLDLLNNQKYYILSNQKILVSVKKSFDGKLSVLNIKVRGEEQNISVYFGKEKINILEKKLKEKILHLVEKQFSNKIFLANKRLEKFFNLYLPTCVLRQKILGKSQQNFLAKNANFFDIQTAFKNKKIDAEFAYTAMQNLCIKKHKNLLQFGGKNLPNFSYQFLLDGQTKTINFLRGASKKIVVNGVAYHNCLVVNKSALHDADSIDVFC